MDTPLKKMRKQKGLTQIQLAEEIGADQTSISKWESGKTYPTKEFEKKLVEYFGVSEDMLLGMVTEAEFAYQLLDAANSLSQSYAKLISDYSIQDNFRRMVRIWSNLTEFQRVELLGFAQGIMGREPTFEGGLEHEGN